MWSVWVARRRLLGGTLDLQDLHIVQHFLTTCPAVGVVEPEHVCRQKGTTGAANTSITSSTIRITTTLNTGSPQPDNKIPKKWPEMVIGGGGRVCGEEENILT